MATYASFPGTLNIGGGNLMPVHQITSVTVSPTHRRRGLLRRMITEDLALAREAGMVFAALTASEATIYGRFGFGRATAAGPLHAQDPATGRPCASPPRAASWPSPRPN